MASKNDATITVGSLKSIKGEFKNRCWLDNSDSLSIHVTCKKKKIANRIVSNGPGVICRPYKNLSH